MENASKALIMAGSILIALIIIGVLVLFFNNLTNIKRIEEEGITVEQATEFNKQYDAYARNVYGSELLSIANKISDYNLRESENKGYAKIELSVKIEKDMNEKFFKKGTYNSITIQNEIKKLEEKIEEVGNISISSSTNSTFSRKIRQLAKMRTNEIEELGIKKESYANELSNYNIYKSLLTEVKTKVFQYFNFEYDKNTGRITKMNYKL